MANVLVVFAHPQFQHSRVNLQMITAIANLEHVRLHDLYELYPDFYIDVEYEQLALTEVDTLVLQHPFQWYSCPALLKEWLDLVLNRGWAYGEGGTALHGKRMLSAITAGGPQESYQAAGRNRYTIDELLIPFDQTAHLCGMRYLRPFIFYNALRADAGTIMIHAEKYKDLLFQLGDVEQK